MAVTRLTRTVRVQSYSLSLAKIADYLLNPEHPKGWSKAKFLLQRGFTAERPDELMEALIAHAKLETAECAIKARENGDHLVIDGPLSTPAGDVHWRSVWKVTERNPGEAEFITGYPTRRRPA